MKIIKNFTPSLAAVFLNENQKKILEKKDSGNLLSIFREKLKSLFPVICSEKKVFSNFDFSASDCSVVHFKSETERIPKECSSSYRVLKKLINSSIFLQMALS